MIEVKINGRDVKHAPDVSITSDISELITSFSLVVLDYQVVPKYNEKVEIFNNGELIYLGLVVGIQNRNVYRTQLTVEVASFKYITTNLTTQYATKPGITAVQAITELVLNSGTEGIGLTGYDISIGEIDDLTQFDKYFESVMTFGSDTIRDSLDRLADLFLAVWWIDQDKKFYFKLIDNFSLTEIEDMNQWLLDHKGIQFSFSEDVSEYVNTNILYSPEIETTEYIVNQKKGQDDVREYIVPYRVARDIKVEQSNDGGVTWFENKIQQKPTTSDEEQTEMWAWEYGSDVILLNKTWPTQPPVTTFRFTYIGLTSTKSRIVDETSVLKDSLRLGVSRAVKETFKQDDRSNTQPELYGQNIAMLQISKIPKTEMIMTFMIDPKLELATKIKFAPNSLIPDGLAFIVASKTIIINNEIYNERTQLYEEPFTQYQYTFVPTITKPEFYQLARKIKETNYKQDTEIIEINIMLDVAYLSIEVDSILIAESTGELHANDGLFANVDLFAGNEELC